MTAADMAHVTSPVQDALDVLVRRHVDSVYAAALRQVRDPDLAADVAQAVFLIFQKKFATFGPETIVLPWLLRSTRYTCLAAMHRERQRVYHERKASTMRPESTSRTGDHQNGLFDAALNDLRKTDRTAIVLTYFEGLSHKELARRLGISEDAAGKRVQRAVEKLKQLMQRRDAAFAKGGVVQILAAVGHPAAAPVAMTQAILHSSGQAGPAIQTLAKGARFMMKMLKVKIAAMLVVTGGAAAVLSAVAYRTVWAVTRAAPLEAIVAATIPAPLMDAPIPPAIDTTPAQVAAARAAVIARQAGFRNFSMAYDMQYDDTPGAPYLAALPEPRVPQAVQDAYQKKMQDLNPGGQDVVVLNSPLISRRTPVGISSYLCTFSRLDAYVASDIRRSQADGLRAGTGDERGLPPEVCIVTPQRMERYDPTPGAGSDGQIFAPDLSDIPIDWVVDVGLGLRGLDSKSLFTEKEWRAADVHQLADKTWEFVITLQGQSSEHWIFDPARSFALTHYRYVGNNGGFHDMACFNFQQFSGVLLPRQMILRHYLPQNGKPTLWTSSAVTINKYIPNDPANSPDRFQMVYASGATIDDTRSGKSIRNDGPDRSFTDEEFAAKLLWLHQQHEPPSALP